MLLDTGITTIHVRSSRKGRMNPKHGTGLWYMGVYHDSNLRISWRCLHQNYQMNDRAIWFGIIGLAIVMGALELSHIQTHMP